MKSKSLKIIISLVIIFLAFAFYLFNFITKGVGNAAEQSIKMVYEVSKSLDSTDIEKLDSLRQEIIQKLDSSQVSKSTEK